MSIKTSIAYDRKNRKWQLLGMIGEELNSFPAGPEGKQQAIIAQLRLEAPEALAMAIVAEKHSPLLNGRTIRAAQIVMNGNVTIDSNQGGIVLSQNKERQYNIDPNGLNYRCNCTDYTNALTNPPAPNSAPRIAGNPRCKHIQAYLIALCLSYPWPPPCPTCNGPMHARHRRDDGSGLLFWSCRKFPACRGRCEFTTHPVDAVEHQRPFDAHNASFERARNAGLIAMSASGQRRQRTRTMEQARQEYNLTNPIPS